MGPKRAMLIRREIYGDKSARPEKRKYFIGVGGSVEADDYRRAYQEAKGRRQPGRRVKHYGLHTFLQGWYGDPKPHSGTTFFSFFRAKLLSAAKLFSGDRPMGQKATKKYVQRRKAPKQFGKRK